MTSLGVTTFTLCALSIDRFHAVTSSAAAAAGGALSVDPCQAVGDLGGISGSGRSGAADVASGAGGVSADGSAGGLVHSAAVRDAAGDTVLAGADIP